MTTHLPDVNDAAPDFTLTAADGSEVTLSGLRGRNVVLYFYPAAMTPGCTTQACDFTAAKPALDAAGYVVLGVSPDPVEKLAKFADKDNLDLVLLSDPDRSVLTAYGAFGEKKNYGKVVQGVIRSTFVIDADGTITHVWRNVKATGHVGRLLKDLGLAVQ